MTLIRFGLASVLVVAAAALSAACEPPPDGAPGSGHSAIASHMCPWPDLTGVDRSDVCSQAYTNPALSGASADAAFNLCCRVTGPCFANDFLRCAQSLSHAGDDINAALDQIQRAIAAGIQLPSFLGSHDEAGSNCHVDSQVCAPADQIEVHDCGASPSHPNSCAVVRMREHLCDHAGGSCNVQQVGYSAIWQNSQGTWDATHHRWLDGSMYLYATPQDLASQCSALCNFDAPGAPVCTQWTCNARGNARSRISRQGAQLLVEVQSCPCHTAACTAGSACCASADEACTAEPSAAWYCAWDGHSQVDIDHCLCALDRCICRDGVTVVSRNEHCAR